MLIAGTSPSPPRGFLCLAVPESRTRSERTPPEEPQPKLISFGGDSSGGVLFHRVLIWKPNKKKTPWGGGGFSQSMLVSYVSVSNLNGVGGIRDTNISVSNVPSSDSFLFGCWIFGFVLLYLWRQTPPTLFDFEYHIRQWYTTGAYWIYFNSLRNSNVRGKRTSTLKETRRWRHDDRDTQLKTRR